ncbi:S-adenosyl-L-methionine-dependent methyltransferase, partial [Tribonema minus]
WPADLVKALAVQSSLPDWLVTHWVKELGAIQASSIAEACATKGPVSIRANRLRTTAAQLRQDLEEEDGIQTVPADDSMAPNGLVLAAGRPAGGVWALKAYQRGDFEVQDIGSQHIAAACDVQAGEWVLDYCAGNGGKALALAAETGQAGRVVCWDISSSRLQQLMTRALRAGAQDIVSCAASAEHLDSDGLLFDVVLVDAPCSSTGVIRRRVGLRAELSGGDAQKTALEVLPDLQKSILSAAAHYVKPGGRLVYATCSLLAAENDDIADWFDVNGNDFTASPFQDEPTEHKLHSGQTNRKLLLPSSAPLGQNTDGFFISRWVRCQQLAGRQSTPRSNTAIVY